MSVLLEVSPYETDNSALIGRDPRRINAEELEASGVDLRVGMKAIRAKCMDCCGENHSEVRKCTATGCPLWLLRMGSVPKGVRELRKGDAQDAESIEEDAA